MIAKRFVTIFVLIGLLFASQPVQAMPLGDQSPATAPASPCIVSLSASASWLIISVEAEADVVLLEGSPRQTDCRLGSTRGLV